MGHRQFFFPPQTSNMDSTDIWNRPFPDPNLHPGTAAIGVHPMPYFDIMLRSNNFPSSNFSLEIPNHNRRANPGPLHDPFLHPASACSSNQMPANYIQGGPSCYDGFAINSHMDYYERAPFKRKNPAIPMALDRGNGSCYHIAGSSSSLSNSSVNSQANPTSGPQYCTWDPNSMPQSYRNNNLLTVGEGSQRNVRSRQSFAVHLGNNQNGAHPPSRIPHHLHPTSNISGLTAAGQWGHTPLGYHRRIIPPGTGSFNHGVNQSHAGSNSTTSIMEIDGGYHHNPVHNRITGAPLATHNGPSSQVVSAGRGSYDQRTHPYRGVSSYQPVGFAIPVADGRQPLIEVVPPRHSRPLSIIGQTSERNGRSRGLYDRFQPFSYGNNAHSGWVSEGRIFYDSRNLCDQHRDMRLDIDNMSYEELLALEERIGNVSTGLSGDTISRYMVETAYCSPNQIQGDQEEDKCVICLEVYKNKENVGRLNCGHNFHSNCIKKWLSIKNVCPVCKASAFT